MKSNLPVRMLSAAGALFVLFVMTVSSGCDHASTDHQHLAQTDQIDPGRPEARHTVAVLSLSKDPSHHSVEQHPEHLVLNSMNGDTVQWYAAGADFVVDLGPNHPFDYSTTDHTIDISRGTYSQVLRFRDPGTDLGIDDYGDYSVREKDDLSENGGTVTSHPEVIFDP